MQVIRRTQRASLLVPTAVLTKGLSRAVHAAERNSVRNSDNSKAARFLCFAKKKKKKERKCHHRAQNTCFQAQVSVGKRQMHPPPYYRRQGSNEQWSEKEKQGSADCNTFKWRGKACRHVCVSIAMFAATMLAENLWHFWLKSKKNGTQRVSLYNCFMP